MTKPFLKVGSLVRVLRVPPPVAQQMPEETREIFRRSVGHVFRVEGIGKYGHLEINVTDDGVQAPNCCHHTIWIESEHVEAVASKNDAG